MVITSRMVVGLSVLSSLLAVLLGCKEDPPNNGGAAGFAGMAPIAGAAGMAPIAGMGAGTGGAGMGGAGMGGGAFLVPGCEVANTTLPGPMLHAEAASVLSVAGTCGFSSCHDSSQPVAQLVLLDVMDFRTQLVGKPACQAPMLSIVDGSGMQAGLERSYLWIKLVGQGDPSGNIMGNAATWGAGAPGCGQTAASPYGIRMPFGAGTMPTSDDRLSKIRNWICAGAPGPM